MCVLVDSVRFSYSGLFVEIISSAGKQIINTQFDFLAIIHHKMATYK